MKNYTLSIDSLSKLCEITETIDYLNHTFPGFLGENIEKYTSNRSSHNSGEEKIGISMMAVALAFGSFIDNARESKGNDIFRSLFDASTTDREEMLASSFAIPEDQLTLHNVDIDRALEYGHIVLVKSICINSRELEVLKYLLNSRLCVDNVEQVVADSLKAKLNG